jgi:hypothetical protein
MSGRELRLFDPRAAPPSWTARMSAPRDRGIRVPWRALKLVISGLLLLAFNHRHLLAAWRRAP